jgi:hypothetical protein
MRLIFKHLGLAVLCLVCPASMLAQVTPLFVTVPGQIPGQGPAVSFPPGTTAFPLSSVVTTIVTNSTVPVTYTTNTVTNSITGIIDIPKETCLAVEIGEWLSNSAATSGSLGGTVVWQIAPSLDGINFDTSNGLFNLTNTFAGGVAGTNAIENLTQFPPEICGRIEYYRIIAVVNHCTNTIWPATPDATAGYYDFVRISGRPFIPR